ncbi:hypothetical protein [Actinopolyspora mortivallis]|uniref:hypothetical protein n=1 Tax=Actinopolyspora mortivallis TaxID=33906 RepID=UPI0012ED4315|nr:hypothetical protein [Actinopolyspora mortivallis]
MSDSMRLRGPVGFVAVLVVALSMAGCASTPGHRPPNEVGYPFGGVTHFSERRAVLLHEAKERLIAECMADRGFTYEVSPAATGGEGPDNPYGLLSPEEARKNGYGMTMRHVERAEREEKRDERPNSRGERWKEALTGTEEHRVSFTTPTGRTFTYSSDGCVHRARTRLYGKSWYRDFHTIQSLSNRVIRAVTDSEEFKAAQQRWSDCMSSAGHDFDTIQGPLRVVREELSEQGASKEVADLELSLSRQDARCQRRAELPDTVEAVQRRVESNTLSGHRDTLDRLRASHTEAVARARDLVRD